MDWLVDCETLTEAETLRVKLVENEPLRLTDCEALPE